MGIRVAGLQLDDGAEMLGGRSQPSALGEQQAELGMRRGVIRRQPQGFLVFAFGVRRPARQLRQACELIMRLGQIRGQRQRRPQVRRGFVAPVQPGEGHAQIVVHIGAGFEAQRLLITSHGLGHPLHLHQGIAQVHERVDVVRGQAHGGLELGDGFRRVTLVEQGHAPVVMRSDIVRLERDGAGVVRVRLGRLPLLLQNPGEVVVRPRTLRERSHGVGPQRESVSVGVVASRGQPAERKREGEGDQQGGAGCRPSQKPVEAGGCSDEHRRQGQVHAVFSHGLGDHWHDTRARGQDEEEPGTKKTAAGLADQRPDRETQGGQNDNRLPPNLGE